MSFVESDPSLTQLALELYRQMHSDWLLTPFALHANILIADINARELQVHWTYRLQALLHDTRVELPKPIPFGMGVSGRAAAEGRPVYESDVNDMPPSRYVSIIPKTKSNLAVPIMKQGNENQLIAVLNIESPHPAAFQDPDDLAFFTASAADAARRLAESHVREIDRVLTDLEVSIELGYLLEKFLHPIYDKILTLRSDHRINLFLTDPERRELTMYQTGYFHQIERAVQFIEYGKGVTGRAAFWEKPVYVADTSLDRNYVELTKETQSNFAVPVMAGDQLVAVVNIENPTKEAFPPFHQRLIEQYCALAGPACQTARRLHFDEQRRHFTHALQKLTHLLVAQNTRRGLCDQVVESVVELTGAAFGSLQLFEPATDLLIMMSVWPPRERDRFTQIHITKGQGVSGEVASSRKPCWVQDVRQRSDYIPTLPNILTELAVPIISKEGDLIGVLNVEWDATARPIRVQAIEQLRALADIALIGLSIARANESSGDLAQHGRDKLLLLTRVAEKMLHHNASLNSAAGMNLDMARQLLEEAGARIETDFSGRRSSTHAGSKTRPTKAKLKILELLCKSDLLQEKALDAITTSQNEWDEFRAKVSDIKDGRDASRNISIDAAVQEAITTATASRTWPKSVEIILDLAPELPTPVLGLGLVSILQYLITNAGEAMPTGGQIKIAARRWEEDPTLIEIRVSDTGWGVTPENSQRIFMPMYSGKSDSLHSGLGLYIARALAESEGGWLDLVPDATAPGATFALRLPTSTA